MKKALEGNDTEEIKSKTEALKNASYKIAEEVYKQQAAQGNAQPGADASASSADNAGGADESKSSGFDKGTADDVQYEVHDDK